MRIVLTFVLIALPGSAFAHWGHVADVAGHTHWGGLAALGGAIGTAIWIGLSGKKDDSEDETAEEVEPDEPVEA